jgi:hypothetical protein
VVTSRKHHFIPAFYLKQWAGPDGRLIQWSRPHKIVVPKRRHADATGYELDLNNFDDMPPQIATFMEDHFLRTADNEASLALQQLLSKGSVSEPRLREAWVQFLISLPLRHPDILREVRMAIHSTLEASETLYQPHYEATRKSHMPRKFSDHLERSLVGGRSQLVLCMLSGSMRNPQLMPNILAFDWQVFDMRANKHALVRWQKKQLIFTRWFRL